MQPHDAFVIRTHAPARARALLVGITLAIVVAGYLLFSWGALNARNELETAAQAVDLKQQLAAKLTLEVRALETRNARLQRNLAVDADARGALERKVIMQREQLGRLREETAFYRTLALPAEDGRTASTLVEFKLYHRLSSERRFRFSIWVARVQPGAAHTSAELELKVLGQLTGQMVELEAPELGPGARVENFSFRHFHRLDGVLTLPTGFEPEAVALDLSLLGEGGTDDRMVRIFPWHVPQI